MGPTPPPRCVRGEGQAAQEHQGGRPDAAHLPAHRRAVCIKARSTRRARPRRALECEVEKRWQPQIRAQAPQKAATTGGIVIDIRACLGYTAPIGSTDQDRIRHLTVALPPAYAARLFEAQEAGAGDARLQEIAAEALKEVYFQDGGRRAGSLEEVRFTDIEHLEFDL
ncbi:telomere-protecting terminal protein Tpg [Streptomyces sp. NBC_01361]|uniref:telomere-protecting terminal protein Tpg n=1 Tax=Streptomyces sp. NBC_01361 TaxID=2903838 RepID=UPI003FCE1DBD